jgi:hypothetical protein
MRLPSRQAGNYRPINARKGNLQHTLFGVSDAFNSQVLLRAKGGYLLAAPVFDLSKWVAGRRLARAANRVRGVFAYEWNHRDCSFWISQLRFTRARFNGSRRAPNHWAMDTSCRNSCGATRGVDDLDDYRRAEKGNPTHLCLRGDGHAGTWLLVNRLCVVRSPPARRK